jgi:hypothetical protein
LVAINWKTHWAPWCEMDEMLVSREEGEGLKGCAARTGRPALALDPLALTPAFGRDAVSLNACPPPGGGAISTLHGVTFLTGRICDFSNGERQR